MNETRARLIDDNIVTTKLTEIRSANAIEVEVGTNGYKGGDSGHGCRAILRIGDIGGTDIRFRSFPSSRAGGNPGIEIVFGGDSELTTFIKALDFAVMTLKEQSGYTDDDLLDSDFD